MPITSSSISSSDGGTFARTFLAWSAALLLGLLGLILALDPYDTGRLALVHRPGVQAQGPRTANASRSRDPRFRGAIFGNSHIQAIRPSALSAATGLAFVSLFVTATGPQAQLALLDHFLRHAQAPRALVIGVDGYWCTPDPAFAEWQPFPFWLYDRSDLAYVRGLVRQDALEAALQRALMLLGLSRKLWARPDGEATYEGDYIWREDEVRRRLASRAPAAASNPTGRFPMLERLADVLERVPAAVAVVALVPPVHVSSLPAAGSSQDRSDRQCRAALGRALARHARSVLLDWQLDRPELHSVENFFDHSHYRSSLARAVEEDVVEAIVRLIGSAS